MNPFSTDSSDALTQMDDAGDSGAISMGRATSTITDIMHKAPLVAVDDGYAQTKLFGELPGKQVRYMMRSSVRPGRYGLASLSGAKGFGSYVTEEGEEFTVSEEVEAENTQFDSFHVSTMNRVLVHHALLAAGFGGIAVDLAVGLPVSDFFMDGEIDHDKITEKKANLLKSVTNSATGGVEASKIATVRVGCQAISAFVDYYIDDDLNERDVPVSSVAVVDIGGRTTDVAMVLDGSRLDESRSGTENMGALNVYNALAKSIRASFRVRDKYPLKIMDETIRSGRIALWGEERDVSEIVAKVINEQEVQIAREIERKLGSGSNVQAVLFVGGGSALFKGIAGRFPNGRMAQDPEFANARGLFKYCRKFPV